MLFLLKTSLQFAWHAPWLPKGSNNNYNILFWNQNCLFNASSIQFCISTSQVTCLTWKASRWWNWLLYIRRDPNPTTQTPRNTFFFCGFLSNNILNSSISKCLWHRATYPKVVPTCCYKCYDPRPTDRNLYEQIKQADTRAAPHNSQYGNTWWPFSHLSCTKGKDEVFQKVWLAFMKKGSDGDFLKNSYWALFDPLSRPSILNWILHYWSTWIAW